MGAVQEEILGERGILWSQTGTMLRQGELGVRETGHGRQQQEHVRSGCIAMVASEEGQQWIWHEGWESPARP